MNVTLLAAVVMGLAMMMRAHAQTLDTSKLDQLCDRLLAKHKGMGGLILAKDGRVLYSRSFGYSQVNGTETKPLTATTKYKISSITKTFTAVMVLQLVEEGKLKLNDPLEKWFPQIPNADRITLEQMLTHRSGIPNTEPDRSWGIQPRTKDEVIARIANGRPDFEPGTKSRYCNAGYVLLGYIVERAGGQAYSEALKERITAKIGLMDTYLGVGNTDVSRNESLAYRYLGSWKESDQFDYSVTGGAGAILSTPTDLTKFIQALFDLKLVTEDSLNRMRTMIDGEGMGLVTFSFAGKTLYGNTGGSGSTGAWLAYFPEEKLALAYTTNAKVYPVSNIVSGVLDIYWNRPFQVPSFESPTVSTAVLDRYVGLYSSPGAPAKAKITRDGITLLFQPPGTSSGVPLEAMAENKFQIEGMVVIEFDTMKRQMTIKRRNGVERVFSQDN